MQLPKQVWVLIAAFAAALLIQSLLSTASRPQTVPYSEFLDKVETDTISQVEIRANEIRAILKSGEHIVSERLPAIDQPHLLSTLREKNITFSGRIEKTSWWRTIILGWILPM